MNTRTTEDGILLGGGTITTPLTPEQVKLVEEILQPVPRDNKEKK